MSDRWSAIRRKAKTERAAVQAGEANEGDKLVRMALEARSIAIFPLPNGDPMLCKSKGVYNGGYVAYDRTLLPSRIIWVLAHELGHAVLHTGRCQCAEPDLDDEPATNRLPYGVNAVGVYNSRQQRELEANVFAAAFLLPPTQLRERFLAGATPDEIAAEFGVSPTAALHGLAEALLQPVSASATESTIEAVVLDLDSDQRAAAEAPSGPILVDAGPGTGKTRTLVGRVLHLLNDGGTADEILSITYSNRAAGEMRERLERAAPDAAHALTVCTIHALCLELLRRYHVLAGLPADFAVIDEIDAAILLERYADRLPLEHYLNVPRPGIHFKALVKAIALAKDELATPERYAELAEQQRLAATDPATSLRAAKWAEIAKIYAVYEELLREHGVIDFGGLVMQAEAILQAHPDIVATLRDRWRHILVDEYQDMNHASGRLLKHLAGDGLGLWVVGDLRQAIYRFRGASPANIAKFAEDFPTGRTLTLGINYRSDPQLVDLFSAVGTAMTPVGQPAPAWRPFWSAAPPPHIWEAEAEDDRAEGAGIAAEILRRTRDGRPFRDQAVLVCTHAQAQTIVVELEASGIPVLYLGDLFAREEVRDLLALMSIAAESDGAGLLRVGAMKEHAIPRAERIQLIQFARERTAYFPEALALATEAGLSSPSISAAKGLLAAIRATGWQASPWQFLARYLFGHGVLVRRLVAAGDAHATQQLFAIGQLLALTRAFDERPFRDLGDGERPVHAFLRHVRRLAAADDRVSRQPADNGDLDVVRVLTVHAAKGLEFPVVYVTNLSDQRFPSAAPPNSAPSPPGLIDADGNEESEAQSLFFVAISRAKQELILTRATRYKKTERARSLLLDLAASFFDAVPPERLTWSAQPAADSPDTAEPTELERDLHVAELEHYLRCPRQYAYRHVFGLRERDEDLGYKHFQRVVHRVLARGREQHRKGELGGTEEGLTLLTEVWDANGPRDHPYGEIYRGLAEAIVRSSWKGLAAATALEPWRENVSIELGGRTVLIPIDASSAENGLIRISRIHARPRKSDDHTDRPLALLRAAATKTLGGAADVAIFLEYPGTGEIIEVKANKRYDGPRIEKLASAVDGIVNGRFPPTPVDRRSCQTCPFWVVCPA